MKKIILLTTQLLFISCSQLPMTNHQKTNFPEKDQYTWLEEVESKRSLEFVKAENEKTFYALKNDHRFQEIESDIRKILLAKDRIPWVNLINNSLYNFWRDEKNTRGIWRKTTFESYQATDPKWEVIVDLDELAKKENENWVWKGVSCLPPENTHCLIYLSRGGKDASVVREFNLKTKSFVPDGFNLPEAKSRITWIDQNTLYVGTDTGPDSLTSSGYPRTMRIWKRNQLFVDSKIIHEVLPDELSVEAYVEHDHKKNFKFLMSNTSFYEKDIWLVLKDNQKIKIPMPKDSAFYGVFKNKLLFQLKSDLKTSKHLLSSGSLVALPLNKLISNLSPNSLHDSLEIIFSPTSKTFLQSLSTTKDHILLDLIDNVSGKISLVTLDSKNHWKTSDLNLGKNGVANIIATENEHNTFLASYSDFITPDSIYKISASTPKKRELLKQAPSRFKSDDLMSEQKFVKSTDGVLIPYYIIHKKGLKFDQSNPTLLYGYGGFEISQQPFYLNSLGKIWLERGGVFVLANIRGGGEFGPKWHKAAQKENHQIVFDDFISIAKDLIVSKITSPKHLGIKGGSNGGLLVGGTFIQRPDLFNAVVCEVPLLDMFRYHKLLAGASWMDEYGNPEDPNMLEYISHYSPYQNLKKEVRYPEVFFLTSTKDDRVHPAHARKMTAKMREFGHPVFYYENTEGGHGGAANLEQTIFKSALEYTYLWSKLSL